MIIDLNNEREVKEICHGQKDSFLIIIFLFNVIFIMYFVYLFLLFLIRQYFFLIKIKEIHYNTRAFYRNLYLIDH